MSDLEKFIIEMRDGMDTDIPDPGHIKRFSRRLTVSGRRIQHINFRHVLQIAASVAIILSSGIVIVKSSKGSNKVAANPVVEEFRETTSFYARQVSDKYEDISAFRFDSDEEKEILLNELAEMDAYHRELLKELNANPGDDMVMNALIRHYQIKLEVMDQIIEQLIQLRNNNNYEDEKATI